MQARMYKPGESYHETLIEERTVEVRKFMDGFRVSKRDILQDRLQMVVDDSIDHVMYDIMLKVAVEPVEHEEHEYFDNWWDAFKDRWLKWVPWLKVTKVKVTQDVLVNYPYARIDSLGGNHIVFRQVSTQKVRL